MKRLLLVPMLLIFALTITSCKAPFSDDNAHQKSQQPITDITYTGPPDKTQKHSKSNLDNGAFGYIHYQRKAGTNNALTHDHIPKIDNKELADVITRLELSLPNIYDVGTLATDEYILIGYQTDLNDKKLAASQVKSTAIATVPNYYKVYISDASDAIERISRFKDLSVQTPSVHLSIENMVKEMKKSPQGNITKNNVKNQGMNEDKRKSTHTNDQNNSQQSNDNGNKTEPLDNGTHPINP